MDEDEVKLSKSGEYVLIIVCFLLVTFSLSNLNWSGIYSDFVWLWDNLLLFYEYLKSLYEILKSVLSYIYEYQQEFSFGFIVFILLWLLSAKINR